MTNLLRLCVYGYMLLIDIPEMYEIQRNLLSGYYVKILYATDRNN